MCFEMDEFMRIIAVGRQLCSCVNGNPGILRLSPPRLIPNMRQHHLQRLEGNRINFQERLC